MTTPHFNALTPAQAERLAMLAEECAEVIHVVGKILRHGYTSQDLQGNSNQSRLAEEMVDLCVVANRVVEQDLLSFNPTDEDFEVALQRKLRYTHHQD